MVSPTVSASGLSYGCSTDVIFSFPGHLFSNFINVFVLRKGLLPFPEGRGIFAAHLFLGRLCFFLCGGGCLVWFFCFAFLWFSGIQVALAEL